MKRVTGILLLTVYLLAYGEGHQLLRIPYLVKHFQKHQQADPSMDFAKFIQIHYAGPLIEGDDFLQDQQLPFRNVDFSLLNLSLYNYIPDVIEIVPPVMASSEFHCYDEINKPLFTAFDIFQPPRCA